MAGRKDEGAQDVPGRGGNRLLYGLLAILALGIFALLAWPKDRGSEPPPSPDRVGGITSLVTEAPEDVRQIPANSFFTWSREEYQAPVTFESGGIRITVTSEAEGDLYTPVFDIEAPDMVPYRLRGQTTSPGASHRIGVGRLNPQARIPHVVLASFSGGAHCCTTISVAAPVGQQFQMLNLGEWDGGGVSDFPADVSGDGVADFVFRDNAFLYAFASYADSYAPPVVLNVIGTRVANVSKAPAFRPLMAQSAERARSACLAPEGGVPNGACAAYVAAAARIGRFQQAWSDMLSSHDPDAAWELPTGCRIDAQGECPEEQRIVYESYPEALYQFLIDTGYIAPGASAPAAPQDELLTIDIP